MKTSSLVVAIFLAVTFPGHSYADGCEYDTQCKNDRICENGKCVAPASNETSTDNSSAIATYSCCTPAGKLGPYPNPGSNGKVVQLGDACFGTTTIARQATGHVCDLSEPKN